VRAKGSSNGFSSRAREDCCKRSSKPDMVGPSAEPVPDLFWPDLGILPRSATVRCGPRHGALAELCSALQLKLYVFTSHVRSASLNNRRTGSLPRWEQSSTLIVTRGTNPPLTAAFSAYERMSLPDMSHRCPTA